MNQLNVFDFTASCETNSKEQVIAVLNKWSKLWAFQQEQGNKDGYLHWQGRFSTKVKIRLLTLVKKMKQNWHLSITSGENINDFDYVTKDFTRVDGPWHSTDQPLYIPRQVREMDELRPFQRTIVDSAQQFDSRTINIVYDTVGNNGKSMLAMYIRCHKIGGKITYTNDYRDLMRYICDTPKKPLYIIDIPRAIKKEHMYNFFAALEEIKNGYAYDDRYHFKEAIFDSPQLWVFMNTLPDETYLSRDRWKVWSINDNYELELINFKRNFDDID